MFGRTDGACAYVGGGDIVEMSEMILSCKDAEDCDNGTEPEAGAKDCVMK